MITLSKNLTNTFISLNIFFIFFIFFFTNVDGIDLNKNLPNEYSITFIITNYLKFFLIFFNFFLFFFLFKNNYLKDQTKLVTLFFLIIGFVILNIIIKFFFYSLDLIYQLRTAAIFLTSFFLFFITSNLHISNLNKKFIFFGFNIISIIFLLILFGEKIKLLDGDLFLTNNKNTKNLFLFLTFFFNIYFLRNLKKFSRIYFFIIQISIIIYILLYGNSYIFIMLLIFLFYILIINKLSFKFESLFALILILFFITSLLFIIINSLTGNILNSIHHLGYWFFESLAWIFDWPPRSQCWEASLKNHDLDFIYTLHKKYQVLCWQIPAPYNNLLWDFWLGLLLRGHYFYESFAHFQNYTSYIIGHTNPQIITNIIVSPHNSFLDFFIKFGATSLFVLFFYLNLFLFDLFKNKKFISCIISTLILLGMLFDDYLFGHRFSMTLVLWLSLGLVYNSKLN